jgi:dienelactone hydrolase
MRVETPSERIIPPNPDREGGTTERRHDCTTIFISDTDVESRPIRIFGGTLDDYNPISACKTYVEQLQIAGRDVELTVYPNASHAFDNPLGGAARCRVPEF